MPGTLYTVEQLELIRRLKSTGISLEAMIEAYREMSQITAELDASMQAQNVALAAAALLHTPTHLQSSPFSFVSVPTVGAGGAAGSTAAAAAVPDSPVDRAVAGSDGLSQRPSTTMTPLATPSTPPNPVVFALSGQTPVSVPVTISSSPLSNFSLHTVPFASTAAAADVVQEVKKNVRVRSQRTPMREITTLDDPQELEEFMRNGEEACIADMRQFIAHFTLRQTTVAMMTGVSQPYISKLLNGNHKELSLRCRRNIYSWYLNCRRHPEKLNSFLADPTSRLETNGEGELMPQKRERYVFRKVLLQLLEKYFKETPFPDMNRRVEIATACNHSLQKEKKGNGLMPKEVVSPQVVANWFANKRKEKRRQEEEQKRLNVENNVLGGGDASSNLLGGGQGEGLSSDAPSTPNSDNPTPSPGDAHFSSPETPPTYQQSLQEVVSLLNQPDLRFFEALGLQPLQIKLEDVVSTSQ